MRGLSTLLCCCAQRDLYNPDYLSRRHFHLSCFALPIALVVRGTLVCLITATAALAAGVDSLPMLPGPVLLNVNVSPEELEREPLAGPIVTAPAQLRGNRATVWTQDGVRWV